MRVVLTALQMDFRLGKHSISQKVAGIKSTGFLRAATSRELKVRRPQGLGLLKKPQKCLFDIHFKHSGIQTRKVLIPNLTSKPSWQMVKDFDMVDVHVKERFGQEQRRCKSTLSLKTSSPSATAPGER